jgi:4-aminobutyrate aminotransferase
MTIPGPKAREILDRDAKVISGSYPRAANLVMDHGHGSEVWDVDGNRFLDFASGIAVCATGHSHPIVVEAINRQADQFLHISSDFYHPLWVEISERLGSIAPFKEDGKVFLGNSGTESVEAAIKLARHHTGRTQFIGFYGSFHGRTMGALAFTASKPKYRHGFLPVMSGVAHVPYPNPYRPILNGSNEDVGENVVDFIEQVVLKSLVPAEDCAGILVEPIQGEGGQVVPPDGFFPALRELCDRHGILLIVDEVQTGVGRTGKWWAIEHWSVEPDIVCFAKGIASGIPMGGILAKASVMDWPQGAHGNTFGGNPIACAAALATIDLIEKSYMQSAIESGARVMDALAETEARHPSVGDIRGKGLMIGVELVKDKETKEPAHELRERVVQAAFENGLIMLGSGESSIRIAPALNIPEIHLDEGLMILDQALTQEEQKGLD